MDKPGKYEGTHCEESKAPPRVLRPHRPIPNSGIACTTALQELKLRHATTMYFKSDGLNGRGFIPADEHTSVGVDDDDEKSDEVMVLVRI